MKLFKYEGHKVVIEPEALALKPFKKLWDRDKTKSKETAIAELAFVYFCCDPRSDYMYVLDKEARIEVIKASEGLAADWKIDKDVQAAMDLYESFKPISASLLEDTRLMVDKLRQWLKDIDMTETDDNGKPKYTITAITGAIKQIPALIKELDEVEKVMNNEMKEVGKVRGQKEKTLGDDGF